MSGLNASAHYERWLDFTSKGTVGVIEFFLGDRLRSRSPMERPHTKQTTRGDAPGKSRWMTDGPLSQRAPESAEIHFQAPDTESTASLSQNRLMFWSLEARGRADCGSDCAHPLLRGLCRLVASVTPKHPLGSRRCDHGLSFKTGRS